MKSPFSVGRRDFSSRRAVGIGPVERGPRVRGRVERLDQRLNRFYQSLERLARCRNGLAPLEARLKLRPDFPRRPSGKNLFYQSANEKGGALMTVPLTGGPARQLLPCVRESSFIAGAKGIYYVACDAGPDPLVQLLNPTTGETRALMTLSSIEYRMLPYGLAVSPEATLVL